MRAKGRAESERDVEDDEDIIMQAKCVPMYQSFPSGTDLSIIIRSLFHDSDEEEFVGDLDEFNMDSIDDE